MLRHNINGWNVFHEHKQDAPPIISIRICITRSEAYHSVALSYLYVNLLTQQIQKEAQRFSIAGDIYTSLSRTHYTICVDTLDEDLEDFLILVQKMLRQKIPLEMIQEEKEQQKLLDMWNATQPQALIHASIMELYYGQSHPLGFDEDGTWREREACTQEQFEELSNQDWGASLFLVSAKPMEAYIPILNQHLQMSRPSTSHPYPPPQKNWQQRYICCPDSKQIGIVIVRPASPLLSSREHPTRLGLMTLSGLFYSRINQAIRQDSGASYGIESSYIATQHHGRIEWICFVEPEKASNMLERIHHEIDQAAEKLQKKDMEHARRIAIQEELQREETCSQIADIRVNQWFQNHRFQSVAERCETWRRVQYHDVHEAMVQLSRSPELLLCIGEKKYQNHFPYPVADTPLKYQF